MATNFDQSALTALAAELERAGFLTKNNVKSVAARSNALRRFAPNGFSITKALRGMIAASGRTLGKSTGEDRAYFEKTLTTGTNPGQFLVPTIQADEIVTILGEGGIVRASGARVIPMDGIQKMNVPTETAVISCDFYDQNAPTTPADPGLGQASLDLKTRRSLTVLPLELLRVSKPQVDDIVTFLLGNSLAKFEDAYFFGSQSSAASNLPPSLLDTPGITVVNTQSGAITYQDILNMVAAFYDTEAEPEGACFVFTPKVFFQQIQGLKNSLGNPLVFSRSDLENAIEAGPGRAVGRILGFPVYLSVRIPQSLSSPANKTYGVFGNPSRYWMIGSGGQPEIAISLERYFDAGQVAVRLIDYYSHTLPQPQATVILEGIPSQV